MILAILLFSSLVARSSGDSARTAAALKPRSLAAVRLMGPPPRLDGSLDDPVWLGAPAATDFIQTIPHPGALSAHRTEARVLYDDHALYIGVRAYDEHPADVIAPYPRRDDETTSDWLFVEIDSRHDRRTAFSMGVNPRGVQADGMFYNDIIYDGTWNGVYEARTRIDSLGWTAVYRIPFSQLPYERHGGAAQTWGFNVYRNTQRAGETSNWSPRLPTDEGVVSHFNALTGIVPPASPGWLELTPYAALSAQRTTEPTAGLDARIHVTSELRLTTTIHPDFGQVDADSSQVNLTPYETFLTERRPFFVEGADQFQFDSSVSFVTRGNTFTYEQPFYSRRIGRAPQGSLPPGAVSTDIPTASTVLGAAKLSGRTDQGWSIGALTALTSAEDATYTDSGGTSHRIRVEPATEYGVARITKDFRQGASALGAIVTFVDQPVVKSALVGGIDGRHRFGGNNYEVSAFALGSLRQDVGGTDAEARLARIGGAWHWSLAGQAISPTFAMNDLGFERNADWLLAVGTMSYQHYPASGWLRRWSIGTDHVGAGWSFAGQRRATIANLDVNFDLRNYWGGTLIVDQDFPSTVTDALHGGPPLAFPARTTMSATVYTDSRSPTQLTLTVSGLTEPGTGSHTIELAPALVWRLTDRFAISAGPEYAHIVNGWQYVGAPVDAARHTHYILGRLDQSTASLSARLTYAFAATATLQVYAQPFLSAGHFTNFRFIPYASPVSFADPDFNQQDMNANAVLRWEYLPGSTLFVVWTQERAGRTTDGAFRFGHDANLLARLPATNTLLIKLAYWLAR